MEYTVYILYSSTFKKIYIGYTSNLVERFYSHNKLGTKGYTKKYRPWEVIYMEYFTDKTTGLKREKQLKTANGRQWIWGQINDQFDEHGFISAG